MHFLACQWIKTTNFGLHLNWMADAINSRYGESRFGTMKPLEPLTLTAGTALLQYVDDLCLCARDDSTCVTDTMTLLKHLAKEGHKVSMMKLQFVKQQVTFLGHVITSNSKSLSTMYGLNGLSFLLCLPCIFQFVSSSVQRLMKSSMSHQRVKITVYPENMFLDMGEERMDDGKTNSSGSYSEMC